MPSVSTSCTGVISCLGVMSRCDVGITIGITVRVAVYALLLEVL